MAVKTFKRRKGENWFDVAARKFGNRDYGYDLIKAFGEGRTGVQYRFDTKKLTGQVGTAMAASMGMNPWGLETGQTPSDFDWEAQSDDWQLMFPQFGRKA